MQRPGSLAKHVLVFPIVLKLMSSLTNRTEPSQKAKNAAAGMGTAEAFGARIVSARYGIIESYDARDVAQRPQGAVILRSILRISRTSQVPARQNLSRSPIINVLLVPSLIWLIFIWLLPKKTPLLSQRWSFGTQGDPPPSQFASIIPRLPM